MATRDHQRSKVYAWEERVIAPRAPDRIAFDAAQGIVDAIWAELELRFPPKVEPLPRQSRTTAADADRLIIRLPEAFPAWHLLHEIAHALSTTHDGQSDGHGPIFAGLYVQLLTRYLRFDAAWMRKSLHSAGIAAALEARPVFLDALGSRRCAATTRIVPS